LQAITLALCIVRLGNLLSQLAYPLAPLGHLFGVALTACKPKGTYERESYGFHGALPFRLRG
jgi:hypothetical protein